MNFKFYLISHLKESLGREVELIPFAITGFILSELNVINILQKYKLNTFIISLLIYNLIFNYEIFSKFQGVAYHGIKLNVLANCVIFLFSLFSFEELNNNYLKNIIKTITNYTGGIFYLHQMIHFYCKYFLNDIKRGTFFGLFLIYSISYIICFFGTLILGKSKAKYLFS